MCSGEVKVGPRAYIISAGFRWGWAHLSNGNDSLWVITSFFNPAEYRRRLLNYRQFRAALHVPLAAVELSFNGAWELAKHDADILIRVTDGDVMWQKERLLNLAVRKLPPDCEYVAWIDADVLMQDPDWSQQAVAALASVPLVQLFSEARALGPDGEIPELGLPSAAAFALQGDSVFGPRQRGRPFGPKIKHGMAWVARRELLESHGLYDAFVIGGGDNALLGAAYGAPGTVAADKYLSAAHRDHYLSWSAGLHADVRGRVGALDGEIHYLWHGDLQDRRYGLRHEYLAQHNFDPRSDIRLGADGAWRWASDKPALHSLLRDYFRSRNEDGFRTDAEVG